MFTGIIEQKGKVIANNSMGPANRLQIEASFTTLETGESIAINGVCLTLLPGHEKHTLEFDVSPETLSRTSLAALKAGDPVNLERAMTLSSRFGGHYVSGHVDSTACLKSIEKVGDYIALTIGDFLAADASMYLLPKGSITLEGVSLTINEVSEAEIKLMLIPLTLEKTTLGQLSLGHRVNIEFDYLTRIVAHQLNISGQFKNKVETE